MAFRKNRANMLVLMAAREAGEYARFIENNPGCESVYGKRPSCFPQFSDPAFACNLLKNNASNPAYPC